MHPEPAGSLAGRSGRASRLDGRRYLGVRPVTPGKGGADGCGPAALAWQLKQGAASASITETVGYPPAVDWRRKLGGDWTTPIRNQGPSASCVAFATTAAIESPLKIAFGDSGLQPDLSEAHLYFCGGRACGAAWWPSWALEAARTSGIADEACDPYLQDGAALGLLPRSAKPADLHLGLERHRRRRANEAVTG